MKEGCMGVVSVIVFLLLIALLFVGCGLAG